MAPSKKDDLADAQTEQQILDLRLMGYSWRDIEGESGVNYETARRIYKKALASRIKEQSKRKLKEHLAEEYERFSWLIKQARDAWISSKGEMSETVSETGYTDKSGSYDKNKVKEWVQTGDVRFIQVIKELQVERNRILGVYDKERDDDDKVDLVRFEQNVYIPGLGDLTPELMDLLIQALEAKDE